MFYNSCRISSRIKLNLKDIKDVNLFLAKTPLFGRWDCDEGLQKIEWCQSTRRGKEYKLRLGVSTVETNQDRDRERPSCQD